MTELVVDDPTPVGGIPIVRVRRRWPRRVLLTMLVLATCVVGYYLITLYQVHATGRSDEARPVDAIVVMGAAQYDGRPSPQLAARLDHAVELWDQGLASAIVGTVILVKRGGERSSALRIDGAPTVGGGFASASLRF